MFKVEATRGDRGRLAVPFMQTSPTRAGGVNIAFALTEPGEVSVVIESPTGRTVRTLARQFAGEAGQNSVSWDGRDDSGRRVPAGQYRCRVLVHTPDGQKAVNERFVIVNR